MSEPRAVASRVSGVSGRRRDPVRPLRPVRRRELVGPVLWNAGVGLSEVRHRKGTIPPKARRELSGEAQSFAAVRIESTRLCVVRSPNAP